MKVQVYTTYSGTLIITAATPRAEAAPSFRFTNASIHEDYCAQVRALLKEHRHILGSSLEYPAAKRLQTYFPTSGGNPLYAIRELMPAGSPRDVDPDFQLEIMRIRYSFMLNLLPAAFLADETIAEAIERHIEKAVHDLFIANGVPDVFIPGDEEQRPGERTDIDILCELGPASGRIGVDLPTPSQT